jgi:raffinose/stachyose/melibiose transport system substrate-binding protein
MRSPSHPRRLGLAALAAASLVLAACAPGSGSESSDEPTTDRDGIVTDIASLGDVTLTVWDQEVRGGQNEQMERLNAAFEEKYPNVTIERVSQSFDDLNTTLRLALTDNEAPDVIQANNSRSVMGAFVEAGQLLPLNEYAEAYGWYDRYGESVLTYSSYSADGAEFGGENLYGLAQVGEVVGVFYNSAKLDALGLDVPATWADFEEALAAAKAAGETPIMLGNLEGWPAMHVFGPLQPEYVDTDDIVALGLGNPGASWTTDGNVEAATTLQGWVTSGYFNDGVNGTDYDPAWQDFAAGTGVFLIGGSWLAADLDAGMGSDVGFFLPATSDGVYATTGATGLPFAITSASDAPDVAAAYIDFITSDEAMEVLAETGNMPVNRTAELAPDEGVNGDVFRTWDQVTTQGVLLPYLDWATPSFYDTLAAALQDLLASQVTPAQFVEALEADYAEFTGQ